MCMEWSHKEYLRSTYIYISICSLHILISFDTIYQARSIQCHAVQMLPWCLSYPSPWFRLKNVWGITSHLALLTCIARDFRNLILGQYDYFCFLQNYWDNVKPPICGLIASPVPVYVEFVQPCVRQPVLQNHPRALIASILDCPALKPS